MENDNLSVYTDNKGVPVDSDNEIRVGSFIKTNWATSGRVLYGLVLRIGTIPFGKKHIPVYIVDIGDGRTDVIPQEDAILITN